MFVNVALDFQDIPQYLMTELNLPSLWSAGLLATILALIIVVVPCVAAKKPAIGVLFGGFVLFFAYSLEWLDSWLVIVQVMLIAGLATFGALKKVF